MMMISTADYDDDGTRNRKTHFFIFLAFEYSKLVAKNL